MRQLYRPSLVRRWERERAERTTHIEKTLPERPAHPFPRKARPSRRSTALECTARYTLARYCAERGVPYGERGAPVSLEVFSQYALSFQRALAPNVEQVMVDKVDASGD